MKQKLIKESVTHFKNGTIPKWCHSLDGIDINKVYLFYNPLTKLYKIGVSTDVNTRLKQIQSISGIAEIACIAYLIPEPGDHCYAIEKLIHGAINDYRVKGTEWFKLSNRVLRKLEKWLDHFFEIESFTYETAKDNLVIEGGLWLDDYVWDEEFSTSHGMKRVNSRGI